MKSYGYYIQAYERYLGNKGLRETTRQRYKVTIRDFCAWLKEQKSITDIREVSAEDMLAYRKHIATTVKKNPRYGDKPTYSPAAIADRLNGIMNFFTYLKASGALLRSPCEGLDLRYKYMKRVRESIPEETVMLFLDSIDGEDQLSLRDRTLFELMYGTGIRTGEVRNLDVEDVDLKNSRLFIREGKGRKDRVVPLGEHVKEWLQRYIRKGRPALKKNAADKNEQGLFLSLFGIRVWPTAISRAFKRRLEACGIAAKKLCPHMLRHSFATHMLEHGAGIKQVKEILGHSCIETTVRYTHFSVKNLKRIMRMYHPRENELFAELSAEDKKRYTDLLKKGGGSLETLFMD
jgi:integrase/recombinase XerD